MIAPRLFFIFPVLILVSGCAGMPTAPADGDRFDLKEYFNGSLQAWGVVEARNGEVLRRFKVDLIGRWDGNRGELYELFNYVDGSSEERTWILEQQGDGQYTGTAADVVGVASGSEYGPSFRWNYVLEVPYKDGSIKVRLDDRLHRIDEKTVLNRAVMKKFGFDVGYITLFFLKD